MRAGAMDGRYIMDWNKDNVADAGFAEIDILSLPVLDQIEEALTSRASVSRLKVFASLLSPARWMYAGSSRSPCRSSATSPMSS